jgi:hypothetical protein
MSDFYVGQRVKCVDNSSAQVALNVGAIYEVSVIFPNGQIALKNETQRSGWNSCRFEPEDELVASIIKIQNANAQPTPR